MSNKTVLIALLDKTWPPDHSFVTGMLAKVVAEQHWLIVRLIVSDNGGGLKRARRYRKAVCLPALLPRRGLGRFLNFLITIRLLNIQLSQAAKRTQRIVLFVRNDPMLLLAASFQRPKVDRLVFQSSFPHEEFSGGRIKRHFAKSIYRFAGSRVDAVSGVNPLGVERISRYFPKAQKGPFIPLVSDFEFDEFPPRQKISHDRQRLQFVYIGTHSASRELTMVLKAVAKALNSGAHARFRFVGGSETEIEFLSKVSGVAQWLVEGSISLEKSIPRDHIPQLLTQADIGLSLIPPKPVYIESSPTKLSEYMAAGLAVFASKGIPLQEKMVLESGGGVLVNWDLDEIAERIYQFSQQPVEELCMMQERARDFARQSLNYQIYLHDFNTLVLRHSENNEEP